MTQETLNVGITANDGTGDTFRVAGQKINNNFEELYTDFTSLLSDGIGFNRNNIFGKRSNENINLVPAGTGQISVQNSLLIDNTIELKDNKISTSSDDIELTANGSGSLRINSVDVKQNQISTSISNSDLELSSNGTGKVFINRFELPSVDNGLIQAVKTDGSRVLGFVDIDYLFDHTVLEDGTATLSSSSAANVDTFDSTVYRSTRYVLSIADATNSRYEITEVVVTHDGSGSAYMNQYVNITNHTESLLTFSADVDSGNVRLRAVPVSSDSTVVKFLARRQEV
jgi:hypothetical protein